MKNFLKKSFFVLIILTVISCQEVTLVEDEIIREEPSIQQGVWGFVKFWEGDFMPVYPSGSTSGSIAPVERQIYVFEKTHFSKAEGSSGGGFYKKINTTQIDSTTSNEKGFFQFFLPTGEYSLFVKEDSLYYSNSGDGQGNIFPFTVKKDSLSKVEFNITYKATY
jgi:hypothetical protein